jgi:hypothetical protein
VNNFKLTTPEDIERFWAKVVVDDVSDCWVWIASLSNGYGQFGRPSRVPALAYKVAYETWREPVPEGLQLDHLCRVRACCNPWHLEAVTQHENILRGEGYCGVAARKTHCWRGHQLSGANLVIDVTGLGRGYSRQCRECKRIRRAERKLRVQ